MVQPNIAPMLLADSMALGQGFLSRLLVSAPESLQGRRLQRDPGPSSRQHITAYCVQITDLFEREPHLLGDNGLDPFPLPLSPEAVECWRSVSDEMEYDLLADGMTSAVRGLRNKTPEMALRLAGILTCIEGGTEVSLEMIK